MVNVQATKEKQKGRCFMANSLAHTKWVCKYHIVFTPKYTYRVYAQIPQENNIQPTQSGYQRHNQGFV